jgi:hypothetical protein
MKREDAYIKSKVRNYLKMCSDEKKPVNINILKTIKSLAKLELDIKNTLS